jgi:predicted DsbA family dithiol-disulfide isomerase
VSDPTTRPTLVVWTDPGCPWAWETSRWLRNLRDLGLFGIEWRVFSLEVNTAGLLVPFSEAADRYGEALTAMALARREGGDPGLETYYVALGAIVHDQAEPISTEVTRRAADAAGMSGLVDRAASDPTLVEEIIREYREARDLDVFGVPSLRLGGARPIYGPIMPEAPTGAAALDWWVHISWLIGRDDVYELKRWPRGRRPGPSFTSS